jgi:hypothetical protein
MGGIVDRLADLSWLGDAYADQGWFIVGTEESPPVTANSINTTIEQMLQNTAWAVAVDNATMTREQRTAWIEFRQALRNIPLQPGFPTEITWPSEPV